MGSGDWCGLWLGSDDSDAIDPATGEQMYEADDVDWFVSLTDASTRDRVARWVAKQSSTTANLDPVTWGVVPSVRGGHEFVIGSPGFHKDWRRSWVFGPGDVPELKALGFDQDELPGQRLSDGLPVVWAQALGAVARAVAQHVLRERAGGER